MTEIAIILLGYLAVALLTAHCVFARRRTAFLARRAGKGQGAEPSPERVFERQELEQAKAIALLVGSCWPISTPLLLARRVVTIAVIGRTGAGEVPERAAVTRRRIAALERELGLSGPITDPEERTPVDRRPVGHPRLPGTARKED